MSELTLQHLIGKQVLGQNGKPIGRIEEVVAEKVGPRKSGKGRGKPPMRAAYSRCQQI